MTDNRSRGRRTRTRALVVVLDDMTPDAVRRALADRADSLDATVLAPNSKLSRLDWLTNDEDCEREEALERAESAADAAGGTEGVSAHVAETNPGESDPVLAVEDALRLTEADEVIVLADSSESRTWLEEDLVPRLKELDLPTSVVLTSSTAD